MKKYDLIAVGRACLDETCFLQKTLVTNRKTAIQERVLSGGGQAATSAVIVAQLGGKSAYAGYIGNDPNGKILMEEFQKFGVCTEFIKQSDHYHTPKALILVDNKGDRTILYEPNERRNHDTLPLDLIRETRCLIIDPEISEQELDKVLAAKPKDTYLVYDAERKRPTLDRMVENADFFIASETILDLDENKNRHEMLRALKERVNGELIITFGERGSIWFAQEQTCHVGTLQNMKIVDTTGAGDVYHATFALFYPKEKNILETMQIASVCAAISTQSAGTRHINFPDNLKTLASKIPTRVLCENELNNFLNHSSNS